MGMWLIVSAVVLLAIILCVAVYVVYRRKPKHCCQAIDGSGEPWKDCNACDKARPFCEMLVDKDACARSFGENCAWQKDKCLPRDVVFAKDVECSTVRVGNDICFNVPPEKREWAVVS